MLLWILKHGQDCMSLQNQTISQRWLFWVYPRKIIFQYEVTITSITNFKSVWHSKIYYKFIIQNFHTEYDTSSTMLTSCKNLSGYAMLEPTSPPTVWTIKKKVPLYFHDYRGLLWFHPSRRQSGNLFFWCFSIYDNLFCSIAVLRGLQDVGTLSCNLTKNSIPGWFPITFNSSYVKNVCAGSTRIFRKSQFCDCSCTSASMLLLSTFPSMTYRMMVRWSWPRIF